MMVKKLAADEKGKHIVLKVGSTLTMKTDIS
jgi:hypothetical protein